MDIQKILTTNSTQSFGIEYKVFLSNHLAHGIIALYKLGADENRIQNFIDWYAQKLEKREEQPEQISLPVEGKERDNFDMQSVLGKRISYFPIVEYYEGLLSSKCDNSIEEFVSIYFPKLADGMCCALLHGLIHLGYGFNIKNPKLVVEGMAYLHHSYLPIRLDKETEVAFGSGTSDILEVIDEVKNDKPLLEYMDREASRPDWMPWYPGNAQKRVNILAKDKGNEIAAYICKIKVPGHLNMKTPSLDDVLALMDWVIDCAITVYKCSEKKNDFFFLHGVTGAWSLRQLLTTFKENQIQEAVHCVKLFLIVLFATYMTQDCPVINPSYLKETTKKSWNEIIADAIKTQTDEHIYKLVQVCEERTKQTKHENDQFYKTAALLSMSRPFF